LTAGSVVIILAGRHKGQRVVFLKQLKSGLLLVTGPFKVNGCPLRRVNQAYVIATSTRLNLSADVTKAAASVDDAFFKRLGEKKAYGFLDKAAKDVVVTDAKKKTQAAVDKAIVASLTKIQKQYLAAKFTLTNGQYPHNLKF
jgi:large subunit ribosomal protein L6e